MNRTSLGICCAAAILPMTAALPAAGPAVLEARIAHVARETATVGLSFDAQAGAAVGDHFWIITDEGVAGWGDIFLVAGNRGAGRLAGTMGSVSDGMPAVILRQGSLSELRDLFPPEATVAGRLLRVPPGRETGWIDIGGDAGLRAGDQVLVWRNGLPLSRGRVAILDRGTSLVTLEPVVRNALPEPGDRVELWPYPADVKWGKLTTTVLASQPIAGPDAPDQLQVVGSAADGMAETRLLDIYRGRRYLGVAEIVTVSSPNSAANTIVSASRIQGQTRGQRKPEDIPAEGDRAVLRPAPEGPPAPLTVAVFKVEQDYCLINAGEVDGIKEGEVFLVRRQDPSDPMVWYSVANLKVEKVEEVYSRAQIRYLTSQVAGVQLWDMAERQIRGVAQWRTVGIVQSAEPASRTAVAATNPGTAIAPGTVVNLVPEGHATPCGAVVIHQDSDHLLLHLPPGWGHVSFMARARVDAPLMAGEK